jgi:2-keto-4-pentenoate hydratase
VVATEGSTSGVAEAEQRRRPSRTDGRGSGSAASDPVIADLADRLWQAEVDAVPIDPVTDGRPEFSVDDAYAVQSHNVDRRVAAGAVVCGRKVGLTSRVSQDLLGVREPNFGALLDDMFVDEADEVTLDALVAPRVEAEIAFVMADDLAGPGVTTTRALAAIDGALAAIEVVDSRIADWRIKLADTVADNASASRVVLGARIIPVGSLDLRLVGVLFSRNGAPIDSGAGAAVLGNPARCVAWLANRLGSLGSGLRAGDVVLPGALHRMVPVRPGDVFQARFAHLGSVTAQFSGAGS